MKWMKDNRGKVVLIDRSNAYIFHGYRLMGQLSFVSACIADAAYGQLLDFGFVEMRKGEADTFMSSPARWEGIAA